MTSNNLPTWDFTIYDTAHPRKPPDTSTAAKMAAVTFEQQVRNEPVEHGAFFRADGSLILRKKGDVNSIDFSDAELTLGTGSLFAHNHPAGNSFSVVDVLIASKYRLIEIRAVAANWRHFMAPRGFWPSRPAIIAAVRSETHSAQQEVDSMIHIGNLDQRYANWELQHQIWVKVAKKLNFRYVREPS